MASSRQTTRRLPTEAEVDAWQIANPNATRDELRAFMGVATETPVTASSNNPLSSVPIPGAPGFTFGDVQSGRIQNLLQGTPLVGTFADEALGFAQALPSLIPGGSKFKEELPQRIQAQRAAVAGYRQDKPIGALGDEVTVSLLGGGALAKAITKPQAIVSLLNRIGRAGRYGLSVLASAGEAGLGGIGAAEGSLGERTDAAALPAAFGATVAAGLPAGEALLHRGTSLLRRMDLLPNLPTMMPSAEAATLISATMRRDLIDPRQMLEDAGALAELPQAPIDYAGPAMRKLTQIAFNVSPPTAKDLAERTLETRSEQAYTRFTKRLDEILNTDDPIGDASIKSIFKDLREFRGQRAAMLYPEAEAVRLHDPEILNFMRRPDVAKVYESLRATRILNSHPDIPPSLDDITTLGVPTGALNRVANAVEVATKKGVASPEGITAEDAKALKERLEVIMEKADVINPKNAIARKAYADDSSVMDHLVAGRGMTLKGADATKAKLFDRSIPNFKSADYEDVRDYVTKLNTKALAGDDLAMQQLEAYLIGAYGAMRRDLQRVANPDSYLSQPDVLEKIKILAGNRPHGQLVEAMRRERVMNASRAVTRLGSVAEDKPIDDSMNLVLAGFGGFLGHTFAAMSAAKRVLTGQAKMTPEVAAEIMQQMTAGSGGNFQEFANAMKLVEGARDAEVQRQFVRRVAAGQAFSSPINRVSERLRQP